MRLSVELPGEEVVPTHTPSVTAAGASSVKKVTKTQVAAAVREVAASGILLAVKEAFAASPSTRLVHVNGGFGGGPSVIRAEVTREALADAPWSLDAVGRPAIGRPGSRGQRGWADSGTEAAQVTAATRAYDGAAVCVADNRSSMWRRRQIGLDPTSHL